jgi:pimeloyl-ACP methyl ester carboxylesterase
MPQTNSMQTTGTHSPGTAGPERAAVDTSFGSVSYLAAGDGPTAVFVHGVLLNAHLWDGVVARVADLRRCVAVDLMGHGGTRSDPDQDLSFGAQADMVAEAIAALGGGPVDLVGNDSGGAVCQILAARHPDLVRTLALTNCDVADDVLPDALVPFVEACKAGQALALFEPMLDDLGVARAVLDQTLEAAAAVPDDVLLRFVEPLVDHERGEHSIERWMAALTDRDLRAAEAVLPGLDVPALVLWGDDDVFFPLDDARALAGRLPGSRLVEVPGARLFHPLERPELLAGHLRQLWGASSGA